jgi:autotransporter-associated beta strand protein
MKTSLANPLLALSLVLTSSHAADVTWNGSVDGDWANTANWTGGTPSATNRPVFAAVGAGNLSNSLTAATAVDGMLFNNDAGDVTVTASKNFKLTIGSGETITVTAGDHFLLGTGTSTGSGNQAITLSGTSTWDIATGASLTNQARTTRTGGSSDFNKLGGGLLVIDANNSGSGATQAHWKAQAGTLRFVAQSGVTDALGNSANAISVSNGATVEMQNGASTQRGVVTLNGMGVGGLGAYLLASGTGQSHTNLTDVAGKTVLATDSAIGVSTGASLTMTRPIEETGGARSLTKVGDGILTINNTATYTGSTLINAGTLTIGAAGSFLSPSIQIATGAIFDVTTVAPFTLPANLALSGTGSVAGSVIDATGTVIRPGGSAIVGSLTFNNDLDLSGNGSVEFDIASISSADKILVTGNLTPSGVTPLVINTQPPGGLTTGASYNLFEVTGTLGGTTANFSLLNKTRSSLSLSFASNNVVLNVDTGVAPQSLIWSGGVGGNTWGVNTTANWNSGAEKFFLFDTVSFTDAGVANNIVDLTEALAPTAVTVDSSGNYQFTGSGRLTGSTGITKSGSGNLTVSTANDYNGDTTINAGKLILGVAGAIPSGAGKGNLTLGGGILDVAGFSITANNLSGTGTLDNSGAASTLTFRQTTDTTFSGLISNTGSPLSLLYATAPRLTLSGANNTFTGATTIGISGTGTRIGTLRAAATQALGTGIVTIGPGGNDATATLELSGGISLNNGIDLPARTTPETAIRNVSGNNTLSNTVTLRSGGSWWKLVSDAGKLTLTGSPALTVANAGTRSVVLGGSADIDVSGVIQDQDGTVGAILRLQKEGSGTATLSGLNTYTGSTTVTGGTLVITQDDVIADASSVILANSLSLNLTHSGTDIVGELIIGGITQPNGTYTFGTGKLKIGLSTPFEDWATAKGLTGAPGFENGPADDPDKDGSTNLAEFAFNGNPLSGTDSGIVKSFTADSSDVGTANELILTVAVRSGTPALTGTPSPTASHDGITYTIHGSVDLSGFTTAVTPVDPFVTGLPNLTGSGYEYRSFSLDGSDGLTGKGFLRALVATP